MEDKRKQLYDVLKKYEKLAYIRSKKYSCAYNYYKYMDSVTSLPVIIISAFTGSINFSSTFSCNGNLSTMISSLNIFCAALLGVGKYYRFSDIKEQCKNTMNSYDKMFNRIYMEMNLIDDDTKVDDIKRCVNETERFYEQIHSGSPMIPMFINKKKIDLTTDQSIFISRTVFEDSKNEEDNHEEIDV